MAKHDYDLKNQAFMRQVKNFDEISQASYSHIIRQPLDQRLIDLIHAGNKMGVSTLNLDVSKIKIVIAGILAFAGFLVFVELASGILGLTPTALMNVALGYLVISMLIFYFDRRLIRAFLLKFCQRRYVFFSDSILRDMQRETE